MEDRWRHRHDFCVNPLDSLADMWSVLVRSLNSIFSLSMFIVMHHNTKVNSLYMKTCLAINLIVILILRNYLSHFSCAQMNATSLMPLSESVWCHPHLNNDHVWPNSMTAGFSPRLRVRPFGTAINAFTFRCGWTRLCTNHFVSSTEVISSDCLIVIQACNADVNVFDCRSSQTFLPR